jgi:hypothetical protein
MVYRHNLFLYHWKYLLLYYSHDNFDIASAHDTISIIVVYV